MTQEERTNIKVGITVLVAIAVLLAGIGWAKHWYFGAPEQTVRATFPTAAGLERGDPVTVNGVKLGSVQEIELRRSDVVVTMAFPEPIDVRSDATASLAMLELVGGKKIELHPGNSPALLAKNAIIPGSNAGDIGTIVAMITSLSNTLTSITGRADTLFGSMNGILAGDTLKEKLNRTLSAAQGTLADVDRAAAHASTLFSEDGPMLGRTLEAADSALRVLSSTVGENRAGLRVFIDSGIRAVADARRSLARLDTMISGGAEHKTFLYRLTRDESFAMRLDSALESLTKLSEQIRLQGIDANVRFFQSSKPAK